MIRDGNVVHAHLACRMWALCSIISTGGGVGGGRWEVSLKAFEKQLSVPSFFLFLTQLGTALDLPTTIKVRALFSWEAECIRLKNIISRWEQGCSPPKVTSNPFFFHLPPRELISCLHLLGMRLEAPSLGICSALEKLPTFRKMT